MQKYFSLVIKNTLRNPRRTVLTIASVAVSFCLLGLLGAMYIALFDAAPTTPAQALRLVTHNRVSLTQYLPVSYGREIGKAPGVRAVSKYQWFGGAYKDPGNPKFRFAQFGVEPAEFVKVHPGILLPPAAKALFEKERTACIAAKSLADRLGWKVGDRITLVGKMFPVTLDLNLAGIFNNSGGTSFGGSSGILYFNWEYLEEGLPPGNLGTGGPPRGMVHMYQIEVDSPSDVPRVAHSIDAMFANSPEPTKTESEQAFQLSFVSFLGNLKLFIGAICLALIFTTLLVTANTLAMSVRERTRETGVLKALGFNPSEILGIVLSEAGLIAFVGGALGCAAAEALCIIVRQNSALAQFLNSLSVTPTIVVLTLGLAVLLGQASALIPALGAARAPIIDSLRHTG
jgi:putative ABC transport system permease protein